MTYLDFLIRFVGIPLFVGVLLAWKKSKLGRSQVLGIATMGAIAILYTTPWDNYLIMRGVWSYPEGVVLGTFGYVPFEEYGFMLLQTMLAGVLWSMHPRRSSKCGLSFSILGLVPAVVLGVVGALCLSVERGTYAGLILVWAFPPLALQWGLGAECLRESMKTWLIPWAGLTLYLCLADSFAISEGIWSLTPATRSGWDLGNLPVEEALFFAVTNLFVFQGLCLWDAWKGNS